MEDAWKPKIENCFFKCNHHHFIEFGQAIYYLSENGYPDIFERIKSLCVSWNWGYNKHVDEFIFMLDSDWLDYNDGKQEEKLQLFMDICHGLKIPIVTYPKSSYPANILIFMVTVEEFPRKEFKKCKRTTQAV